jgi:hypothetical protein
MKPEGERKQEARLKGIAGLLKGLTYQEMMRLSAKFEARIDTEASHNYPAILLEIADELANETQGQDGLTL